MTRRQQVEAQRNLRSVGPESKQAPKPAAGERLALWLSTSRKIDGLWVGTTESEPHPGLHRVEEALRLIKSHDPLHYARVIHNLERIWVNIIPSGLAHFDRQTKACVFDERYVLGEKMTLEQIASTIVHEATHARLEAWGVSYSDETKRSRIEAICLRRELNFIAKLPRGAAEREQIERALEWCAGNHDYFSNAAFQKREEQGQFETLRYLGTPDWLVRALLKLRIVMSWLYRTVHHGAGRSNGPR